MCHWFTVSVVTYVPLFTISAITYAPLFTVSAITYMLLSTVSAIVIVPEILCFLNKIRPYGHSLSADSADIL